MARGPLRWHVWAWPKGATDWELVDCDVPTAQAERMVERLSDLNPTILYDMAGDGTMPLAPDDPVRLAQPA